MIRAGEMQGRWDAGARPRAMAASAKMEFAPSSGRAHRNPGLDAREKLPSVKAKPEKTYANLHETKDAAHHRPSQTLTHRTGQAD